MTGMRSENLRKSFGGLAALAGVEIAFPPQGISAIVGPNGAGKTTLVHILTGFLRPDEGRCFVGAIDCTALSPHRIVRLGVARTFQDLRLVRRLTALENVLLAYPGQRGESLWWALLGLGVASEESQNTARAMELLAFVGLKEKTSERAGELSYGQQKLLTLACALATSPEVLILDEPVSGLHPENVAHILGLLRDLRDKGTLIVFIEHDLAAVREVADNVILMDHGKVLVQGSPAQVLDSPEIIEAYVA